MDRVRVAVVDDQEVWRLGLVTSLERDPTCRVVFSGESGPVDVEVDLVVASWRAAPTLRPDQPVVVICSPNERRPALASTSLRMMGVLPRRFLTADKLSATVRAAVAGLRIDDAEISVEQEILDPRRLEVLRLLADGADTKSIATQLASSERTVKTLVRDIQQRLGARNRAQAVAEGKNLGLI